MVIGILSRIKEIDMKNNNSLDYEHIPVMANEAIEYLNLKEGMIIVDATIGTGGHAQSFLERIFPEGRLIGIDRDKESLMLAEKNLARFKGAYNLFQANFTEIDTVLNQMCIKKVDAIFFDLGVSSFQLLNPERGFSFKNEGPLDMRMNRSQSLSAYDIVNYYSEEEISRILKEFGEERWHNRIANLIVKERRKEQITTTKRLAEIVVSACPSYALGKKRHPATKTFQALRIAVNSELENLERALLKAIVSLLPSGKICVISFLFNY
jgi:16S rRNA (cytosine1402-N4)-methyltransferase